MRIVKTHAELARPEEIKTNNEIMKYSTDVKRSGKEVKPQCTEDKARISDSIHMIPKLN